MKYSALLCLIVLLFVGCQNNAQQKGTDKSLGDEYQLRKMKSVGTTEQRSSAAFFFFVGGMSSSQETKLEVIFSWKCYTGEYIISKLPIDKIRLKITNDTTYSPTIKFSYTACRITQFDKPETIDYSHLLIADVIYATVTCREIDWPTDVELPLNKQ